MSDDLPVENRSTDESLAVERALDKALLTKVFVSGAILFGLFIAAVSFL